MYLVKGPILEGNADNARDADGDLAVIFDLKVVDSDIRDGAAPAVEAKEFVGKVLDLPAFDVCESRPSGSGTSGRKLGWEVFWKI